MAEHSVDVVEVPAVIAATWPTYCGVFLIDADEDGAVMVLGHPDPRRVLAALNRSWRTVGAFDADPDDRSIWWPGPLTCYLTRRWTRFPSDCEDPTGHAHRISDSDTGRCWECDEIAAGGGPLHWVTPDYPGAVPVTIWDNWPPDPTAGTSSEARR